MDESTKKIIADYITKNRVMLFMKGNKTGPLCGFSARVLGVLKSLDIQFETFDVLTDDSIREGVKEYANWPTIPQLYVDGEFIGGCDIVCEMAESGELKSLLGIN